jgi:hypothetical protein
MTKSIAIALTALLLGSAAVAPVYAQPAGFGVDDDDGFFDFFPDYPERITCLTDNQVRQAVRDQGFSDIYLNVMNDKHVEVRASRDGWVYLLDFNYCTGRIEDGYQLRRAG